MCLIGYASTIIVFESHQNRLFTESINDDPSFICIVERIFFLNSKSHLQGWKDNHLSHLLRYFVHGVLYKTSTE